MKTAIRFGTSGWRAIVADEFTFSKCLLAAEMVASCKKSLKNQLNELFSRVGAVYNRRLNIRLEPETRRASAKKSARMWVSSSD
jgi:phosphomannomutase